MSDFSKFTTMIASEFHRFLMEDEERGQLFPENTLLIFQVEGEEEFNRWHKEMSLRNREMNQPVTVVHLKKWRLHSLIEDMTLSQATA